MSLSSPVLFLSCLRSPSSSFVSSFRPYNRLQISMVAFGEKLLISNIVALVDKSDDKSSILKHPLGFRFNFRKVETGTRKPLILQMIHNDIALEPSHRFQLQVVRVMAILGGLLQNFLLMMLVWSNSPVLEVHDLGAN